MRCWRSLSPNSALHRMMVMQRRSWSSGLRWSRRIYTVHATSLSCSNNSIGPRGVFGIVQQTANIVNEERIQQIRDLLLVREV
jgi:hypothetical protein